MNQIEQIRKKRNFYEIDLINGIMLSVPELFVLDFDGAQGISYRNAELGVLVDDVAIAATLEADSQVALLDQLNATAEGAFYLSSEEAARLQLPADFCSTIYIGDTDDLDVLGEVFSGIAETTGEAAAADHADNAFVLTNRISSVEELAAVVAHEAGHLAGTLVHDAGNDGATLDDFMDHARVKIEAGQSSSFTNEIFTGNSADSGGAIENSGSVTITDVTFSGNRTAYLALGFGGAIYNSGTATISGATFSGNSARGDGGAIYNVGTATLTSAIFTGNSARGDGGAIYNVGTATLTSATFSGNSAQQDGGAIDNRGTATITDATFIGNSAWAGGAIHNVGSATLTDATFSGNRAQQDGGAIYNTGTGTVTLRDATFSGNRAEYFGGAIYNYGGTATLTSATFSGNSVEYYGGAIYNYISGTATLTSAIFTGNSASSGGAIYNVGTATLTNAMFAGNSAQNFGGAICNAGTATLTSATFSGNSAGDRGGAIYNDKGATATITGATFTGNSAQRDGGAIFNYDIVTITDATFSGNSAQQDGGAIYNAGVATITSAIFSGNSADVGGAICNAKTATIISATFSGNSATDGGAIYNYESGTATITDAAFLTAADTIYNTGSMTFAGTITLAAKLTTTDSITLSTGTAIVYDVSSYEGSLSTALLDYSMLSGTATYQINVNDEQADGDYALAENASGFSGSITLKCGATVIDELTVGGPIVRYGDKTYSLVLSDNTLTLKAAFARIVVGDGESFTCPPGKTFTNPELYDGNGGMAEVLTGGTLVADDVTFASNSAQYTGGAIFNDEGATATITGATFGGNNAGYYGGAICNWGAATITDTTFSGNRADYYGGAINNVGTVSITGATFGGNNAGVYGGAICNWGAATITDTMFAGNSATYFGGAICNGGTATLTSATFSGNSAQYGGAIDNEGTVSFCGTVTLLTASDTIYSTGTLNWNLSAGNAGYLNDFSLIARADALSITVDAEFADGVYTLAGNAANAQDIEFTLTGLSAVADVTLTVGGSEAQYGANSYQLLVTNDNSLQLIAGRSAFFSLTWQDLADGTNVTAYGQSYTIGVDAFATYDLAAASQAAFIHSADVYVNSNYNATDPIVIGNYTATYGVDAFSTIDEATAMAKESGCAVVATGGSSMVPATGHCDDVPFVLTGCTVTETLYAGQLVTSAQTMGKDASLQIIGTETAGSYSAVVGGAKLVSAGTVTDSRTTKIIVNGMDTITGTALIGSDYVTDSTLVFAGGTSSVMISSGSFSNVLAGGALLNGDGASVEGTLDSFVTLAGGTVKALGGGCYLQKGGTISVGGTTNISITGGAVVGNVYGGNFATTQDISTSDSSLWNGDTSITIDATNAIAIGGYIAAGSYNQGLLSGNATITFRGIGSNLTIGGNITGDSSGGNDSMTGRFVTGVRTLVFDGFSGSLGTGRKKVIGFDAVSLNASEVKLAGYGMLKGVSNWSITDGTLDWGKGSNDFAGDTMTLVHSGELTDAWTVFKLGTGLSTGWNSMTLDDSGVAKVSMSINGTAYTAIYDEDLGYYATGTTASDYKFYLDSNDSALKVAKLA